MKAIVAAATHGLRQELALRAAAAGRPLAAFAQSPAELRALLAGEPRAWILTGGGAALARPFLEAAAAAEAPALALVSGARASLRDLLTCGAIAVLGADCSDEAMQAAVEAARAGLAAWDPEDDAPAGAGRRAAALSPREREILDAVSAGLSNKQVARRLSLSPNTVKFHLQAAFDKLGAASRAEAVAKAMRRGELSV